jgi:23S rRNA (guanosine2251-2'-O)-methyltransferase
MKPRDRRPEQHPPFARRGPSEGLIPICGRRPVEELLRQGRRPDRLLVMHHEKRGRQDDDLRRYQSAGWTIREVERQEIEEICGGLHHQGVVALIHEFPYWRLEDMVEAAKTQSAEPILLALDQVQDVGNLGAILRTAECAGVAGAILPLHHSASVTAAVVRTSAGAALHLPICRTVNLSAALDYLAEGGYRILGADQEGDLSPFSADLRGAVALVIGSEGRGLRPGILRRCGRLLRIPIIGKIGSLNASAAAAILLYEAARQRLDDK